MGLRKMEEVKSETHNDFSEEELSEGEGEQLRHAGVSPVSLGTQSGRRCFRGRCDFGVGCVEAHARAGRLCSWVSRVRAPCHALCDVPLLFTRSPVDGLLPSDLGAVFCTGVLCCGLQL